MDERLKKALDFSNYRISLFNRKEEIKTKVNTMLTYSFNGGIFKITPELVSFTKLVIDSGKTNVVLIDSNSNPIMIDNVEKFFSDIFSRYFETTNYYNTEYSTLKKARTVSSIYDFTDEQ